MRSILERSLEGRASLEEVFELEEHGRACPRCGAAQARARALEEALAELPSPPVERLDVERAMAAIHRAIDGPVPAGGGLRPAPSRLRFGGLARSATRRRGWIVAAALILIATLARLALRDPARGDAEDRTPPPALVTPERAPAGDLERSPAPSESSESHGPHEVPGSHGHAASAESLAELQLDRDGARAQTPFAPPAFGLARPHFAPTDFNGERMARVREEVSDALRSAGAALLASEEAIVLERFLADFEALTSDRQGARWPLPRIVAGLCAEAELAVAVPGLRYLGARGDRAALRVVAQALGRPELERAACLALIDSGSAGLAELDRAFWDADLSRLVLGALADMAAFAPLEVFSFVEELLERGRGTGAGPTRRTLAAPLPGLLARIDVPGGVAARALLGLADHPLLERADVLDALARAPEAGRVLIEEIGRARGSEGEALLLEAAARLTPPEAFEWVARRARSPRTEALAFATLAAFPGEEALLALLELRPGGRRGDEADFLGAWRAALERDEQRAAALARNPHVVADPPSGRRYLEALVASESRSALPALIALAERGTLDEDDRERALLAAGELGQAADVAQLLAYLERPATESARLAAAAVWAANALDPVGGPEALLAGAQAAVLQAARAVLARPDAARRRTATLLQLARVLQPWLDTRRDPSKDTP